MTDLPSDLEEEILSRVPATSLQRVSSTCKRWNALVKKPSFSKKHFRNAQKQSRVVMLKEYRLCSMSVDLNVVPPSIEFKDALSLKCRHCNNSEQVDIAKVFHCDGLLLCITKDNKPVVWNPCSGETRWIQHDFSHEDCTFALGYGNNQSRRSYRILSFYQQSFSDEPVDGFEIYEFSSNSWRVVNAPTNSFFFRTRYRGVTLKGNSYWVSVDDYKNEFLLGFDFTRERFRRLCFPLLSRGFRHEALSVVREEQLSVLHWATGSSKMKMWVTKNIDTSDEAELSWTKLFAADSTCNDSCFVFTSLLIDEEKKVAMYCNLNFLFKRNVNVVCTIGEENEHYSYPEIPYINDWWWPFVFYYVPSLVQIQQSSDEATTSVS